jgi:hypothetical protein
VAQFELATGPLANAEAVFETWSHFNGDQL